MIVAGQMILIRRCSKELDNNKGQTAVDNKGKPNYNLGASKLLFLK
jgi:hypothetical protein